MLSVGGQRKTHETMQETLPDIVSTLRRTGDDRQYERRRTAGEERNQRALQARVRKTQAQPDSADNKKDNANTETK